MVQKSQKSKQNQTSFCLVSTLGVEALTGQLFEGCQKDDSGLVDQSLLEQPDDLTEPLTPNSEVPLVAKGEEKNKQLFSKRRKGRSCGKCVPVVLDYKAKVNFAVNTNLKEEEILVEESCSKKAVQSMGRQKHCAASKTTLGKEFASRLRRKRCSCLPEVKPYEKDTASQKNHKCSLLEPKQNISNCLEKKKSKKTHKSTSVKLAVHTEFKNLIERDESLAVGLESQEAIGESNKCSVSKLGSLQRSWYLRKRSRSAELEQNQDKRQRAKRRCLSSKLEAQSLPKFKDRPRKGDFSCKLQLQSLDSEDCTGNLVNIRSLPHIPCSNIVEGRKSLVKSHRFSLANPKLVEPPEEEQALEQKYKSCSVDLAQTKSCEDLQALKQNCRCLLGSTACLQDSKKCRSITEEGRHRMVTRSLKKLKMCENDSEKLDWKQEKAVAMEIPWFRQGTLEKQMAIGQIVDSVPTEGRLIARVTGCSEKHGKDEILTSPELKIKIKTSSEKKTEVSNIQYEKLPETDLNTSQECNVPKLLVQSACLQITKLDATEHKDPVSCCLGREATIHCDDGSFPVTNFKCPKLWDIKITENKVEKDPLVVYKDDRLRYLTKLPDFPCRITKNPVVRLFDCSYIKALLNPTSNQTFQSYKLHCELLHVAPSQRKDLSPNRGMGQNDLNCSSNIVQAGRSLSQTNVLVGKGMCQNRKRSRRYQNGKKQCWESKWCLESKKSNKKVKMTEDLEKSTVQEVLSNMDLCSEYRLQIDENAIADPSIITEKLSYNKTLSLTSFGVPDFLLKKPAPEHPNQLVTFPGNKQESKSPFAPYNANDFEKSELKKKNSALEPKTMEPYTDFSTVNDNSVVEMLVGEKITNCNNNIAGYIQGRKAAPKGKTVTKTGKILQFSCQRVMPFSGKNIWPCESCARTSLWFCKDHVSGSEFLRGTDSFANTVQMELHKLLVDTSKAPANKTVDCKTDLYVRSPAAESQLDIPKAFSGIGNKNTDMEGPKQCPSRVTKNAKKYKMISNSPVKDTKNEESMVKRNISTDTQNSMFVDNNKNKAKSLVSKQETAIPQVLKTLSMGNLSKYKIPLLKDKSVLRKERNCYNPQNLLDLSAASVKKGRTKRVSSDFKHLFHSEQINGITVAAVEGHVDRFDRSVAGSSPRESSVYNKDLATSLESDVESSTLKDISNSLSIGYTKKPTEIPVSSEINENNWSNTLAQDKDKFCADILKAYEDDALVLDVIQDDPDLFGNTDELEVTGSKEHVTDNSCSITASSEEKSESSPFPRSNLSKFSFKESPIQAHDTLRSTTDVSASLTKGDGTKSDSLSTTSLTRGTAKLSFKDGQLTDLENLSRSSDLDVKYKFSEETSTVKEKADILETEKIENTEHQCVKLDQLQLPLPPVKAIAPQWQGTVAKPWMNDFRFSWKGPLMPSTYPTGCGSLKVEKNTVTCFGLVLPHGYCWLHFSTLNGCGRPKCRYAHVLKAGDAKLCNELLKKYISIGEIVLLQRAVQIFTDYYKDITRGVQLDLQMLNDLLISLLQYYLLKESFHILRACLLIKVLPAVDILLKMFEHVASMKLKEVVPELIDISSKFVDDGMVLENEHLGYIAKYLSQLQVSSQEINIFMSRFQARNFDMTSICDFGSAIAEFEHCGEGRDWAKLGIVYIHVRRRSENFDDLEKYSLFIANILTSAVKEKRPGVAFCEFATAVNAEPWHNEADKTLLGRIGISVLYAYYRIHQWLKARKVLDTLHALQIHFTHLKGLIGPERFAPRCEIVNVAVEVFLNSGSLDGAVWILNESEWVINTLSWPCDRMDVLNRHNLLCQIASDYITKNHYREAFEVLRNLPGFQNSCDSLDVSQYSLLFNKLLGASSESKSLAISSAIIDFMFAKNIPVDFQLLRAFITALGRSSLWLKARTYYKSALALGCYPPLEGNLYRKLLRIPSYITEVEMLLAIEIFLVSNASSIQSPGASNQILQIVLKRCEGNSVQNKDDYQSAVERLIQATQLATPKLFLKHLTVNINQEQVYNLEHAKVLKWLKENMKWAGKVWLF